MTQKINDDASAWFAAQGQQLQDFEAPPAPEQEVISDAEIIDESDNDRPYGDVPEVTREDVSNVTNMRAIQRPTAEVIVGTMDVIIPLLLVWIIKGSNRDDAKLTAEEHQTLVEAWATYLGDKNVQLSPGTALIVAMLTIYGSKVMIAVSNRNERNEINQLRAQVEEQKEQLRQKEQQLQMARARQEKEAVNG